jgi:hypothetical protein
MPAPYDYTIGEIASPQQSFLQGIQMVDALRKREQDMAAAQAAQQKQQELQALYAEAMKPDAKPDVFERLSFAIDPQKAALAQFQQRTDAQQEATRQNIFSVWYPLVAGKPELSLAKVDEQLAAMQNSGAPAQDIQALQAIRKSIETTPELAQVTMASTLTSMGDKGKALVTNAWEAFKKPVEQRKALAEAGEAEAKLNEATIKLKRLDALQEAELRKSTSAADEQEIKARFAERIQKAELALKNAQSSKATFELTQLKEKADKGPVPEFNAQMGGFVIAPTKANPQGGFIPLNAAADNKQQQSAIKALKTAGYDPVTGQDDISKLIQKSTSGTMETLGSEVLRFFGATTEGRKAINELATAANAITLDLMGGKLGAGVSNADREFIVSQLGDISNPNKPLGERLAGWTAAKNRMITSGMLPPTTGVTASKPSAPTPSSKFDKMSDAELLQMLNK